VLPAATFDVPSSVPFGDSFTLILADAHVPGHPEATGFTYAFDCGDDTGCEVIGYTYAGVEGHDYMALRGPARRGGRSSPSRARHRSHAMMPAVDDGSRHYPQRKDGDAS